MCVCAQLCRARGLAFTAMLAGTPNIRKRALACPSGSVDEKVKLWGEAEGRLEAKHTYTGHTLGVVSVVVGGGGRYAASSALDSVIRMWNLEDNSEVAIIETEPSETWALSFAPVDDQIVVAAAGAPPPSPPRCVSYGRRAHTHSG